MFRASAAGHISPKAHANAAFVQNTYKDTTFSAMRHNYFNKKRWFKLILAFYGKQSNDSIHYNACLNETRINKYAIYVIPNFTK